jgi:hypothetical protein
LDPMSLVWLLVGGPEALVAHDLLHCGVGRPHRLQTDKPC